MEMCTEVSGGKEDATLSAVSFPRLLPRHILLLHCPMSITRKESGLGYYVQIRPFHQVLPLYQNVIPKAVKYLNNKDGD